MGNKYDKVVTVVGPTAAGKTELSLKIADKFDAEIISADSMQIYKDMDIGTAKASKEVQNMIKHHQIDIISPEEDYSVADYQKDIDPIIKNIFNKNKLPMLVGGTGLYINAVLEGFTLPNMEVDQKLRNKLHKQAEEKGNQYVHNKLKKIDPKLADKLHPNDIRRVIRGIEIYKQTGHTKTYYKRKQKQRPPRYNSIKIGLTRNRQELYDKINKRVDQMIEEGLVKEAKHIYENYTLKKDSTASQAIGYKELFAYFKEECSLDEAVRLIKRNSRHYAKRQLTFFKRDDSIKWFNLSEISKNELFSTVIEYLNKNL
ncbi:MAG: tRNA (adenosine(37)-N6)-dimethylallyltransferase MiaA [Bacillota bacterium]